ncbi:glucose-induced degradation protein 8-like protein [Cucumis melo var. makuwa]|uniref:Glucose-induced degradation protein 8-like protein n=2 Tax=Cucumis melo TaxID=3656 RepID=A0A5A7V7L0_CUCMM|nr:glucose-induced degradation protein 8-like protein [Cucumis melo var. makuwa]TYK13480.1 glucose-induced degradation protein 8-like protein [Cucumis melo var. makuwa]
MDVDPRHYDNIAVNDGDIQNIVLSYLVHNCYKETAESFTTCTGLKQHTDYLVDMAKRKRIYDFAVEGNALKAIELTEEVAPGLLEKNEDLHFDLLSLHFVELVCSRKCTEALEFAQVKLAPFGKLHKYVEKLEDFMALLAYEEPEKSPMFHLLSVDYRQRVAESLNRAILAHGNLPSYTAMERLIKQVTVVRQSLSQELGKAYSTEIQPAPNLVATHGWGFENGRQNGGGIEMEDQTVMKMDEILKSDGDATPFLYLDTLSILKSTGVAAEEIRRRRTGNW